MSLIQRNRVVIAAAAAVAIGAPLWMLQPGSTEVSAPPPLIITKLEIEPAGGMQLARSAPIFSPQRAVADAVAPATEAVAATVEAPPAAVPVLVGIIARARGRGVALVKKSDGQTVTLAPGESADGWRLAAIGRDRVTFTMNGEQRQAALDFSNRGAPGGETPSPPPPIPLPPPPTSPSPLQNKPAPQGQSGIEL